MRKFLIVVLITISSRLFAFDFSGVWLQNRWILSPDNSTEYEFSWGKEQVPKNSFDIAIDEENKKIIIFGIGTFEIRKIEEISETEHVLTFYFDRGNFDVSYRLLLQNGREFILENLTLNAHFVSEGDKHRYYRKSGPVEVEQFDKPIYAMIKENQDGEQLHTNEKIQLIGMYRYYDKDSVEYWYITENNEYGYVDENSIQIINEKDTEDTSLENISK
jgi:hypothetical protein